VPQPGAIKLRDNNVRTNGVDFAYVEKRHGTPILLVHGSLGDFNMWSGQMNILGFSQTALSVSVSLSLTLSIGTRGGFTSIISTIPKR